MPFPVFRSGFMKVIKIEGFCIKLVLALTLTALSFYGFSQQQQHNFKEILNRSKTIILSEEGKINSIAELASTMGKDGRWADLDYAKVARNDSWPPRTHLQRLQALAIAWAKPNSKFYHDSAVAKAIHLGLNDWLKHRYRNENWWHNEIGVPLLFKDILILFEDNLTAVELQQALTVMRQFKVHGKAANLIWSADLGIHYAALTQNAQLLDSCSNLVSKEIKISTADGIQPDYSYHQHGERLQTQHYGAAFLKQTVNLAWALKGTEWQIPQEKINILNKFVLEGWAWMSRGVNISPASIDRMASRPDALKQGDLSNLIPLLTDLSPAYKDEFEHLKEAQTANMPSVFGFKYFPYSDFAAYQQSGYSLFLKTISTRTLATESINGENQKGRLLNNGNTYFVKDGNEYFNLMPFWDWDFLPGITNSKDSLNIVRTDFSGGINKQTSGFLAMKYALQNGGKKLNAHKMWATHNGLTVCLISDLKTKHLENTVYTAMDQSRLRDTISTTDGLLGVHQKDTLIQPKWIIHNGLAYVPLQKSTIKLVTKKVSSSWATINNVQTNNLLTDSIFMPLLVHPRSETKSAYAVFDAKTAKEVETKLATVKRIINKKNIQSVTFANDVKMTCFYKAGKIRYAKKETLKVNKPCLVLIDKDKLSVSDPYFKGGLIKVTYKGIKYSIELPATGQKTVELL